MYVLSGFSHVRLIATLWTVAHQAFPVHGIRQSGILIGVGCRALLPSQVVKSVCLHFLVYERDLANSDAYTYPKGWMVKMT